MSDSALTNRQEALKALMLRAGEFCDSVEPEDFHHITWGDGPGDAVPVNTVGWALIEAGGLLSYASAFLASHGFRIPTRALEDRIRQSVSLQQYLCLAKEARFRRALRLFSAAKQREAEEREFQRAIEQSQAEERQRRREQKRARRQAPLCGAKTRGGEPCRRKAVPGKRRCRNHGGLSTGPKTAEGKARSLDALRRGRERQREKAASRASVS